MRAVLTVGHGDRSQLRYVTDYRDPVAGPGEVIVAVAATAVNFHDIFTRRGMPGITIPLPVVVGSDIAGTIASIGPEVTGWAVGDRVLVDPIVRHGPKMGMLGEVFDGGRAEYCKVHAYQLIRVPAEVTLEQAASLPLAYGTAHRMITTRGRVQAGEKVLILGASGGVGVACVQLAKMLGAEVIACASSAEKLERLKRIGADHGINYSEVKITEAVKTLFGKPRVAGTGGVDVAVNFTGGDTWVETQKCVRLRGRILTCGATAGYNMITDARYLWTFEQEMIGSDGWSTDGLAELLSLIAAKKLAPEIDQVLPLEQAAEGERLLEDREVVGKVVIKP